jgi:hypothetical protein
MFINVSKLIEFDMRYNSLNSDAEINMSATEFPYAVFHPSASSLFLPKYNCININAIIIGASVHSML